MRRNWAGAGKGKSFFDEGKAIERRQLKNASRSHASSGIGERRLPKGASRNITITGRELSGLLVHMTGRKLSDLPLNLAGGLLLRRRPLRRGLGGAAEDSALSPTTPSLGALVAAALAPALEAASAEAASAREWRPRRCAGTSEKSSSGRGGGRASRSLGGGGRDQAAAATAAAASRLRSEEAAAARAAAAEALAAAKDSAAELEAVQKKCLELYLPV